VITAKAAPCDEGTIRSIAATGTCPEAAKAWVLVGTILASTIAYIDESVVNIALPTIERDLATSAAVVQWLVNAYTLCLAALLLIGGASADRFGRRKMFVVGVSIFAVASLFCGLSPNAAMLILARAVQGLGAALLIPCSLALIGAAFAEDERGRAIGTWAGFSAIAAAVGPILGGWIVDHLSWRWIFLINPVLALPAIWIASRHIPESIDPLARGKLDWAGGMLALAGLAGACFGLIDAAVLGWTDVRVVASLACGAALLVAFLWTERRSAAPMLPLDLFRSRTFSAINLLTLLLYAALAAAFFFLPFALIQVHGYSSLSAGAAFLPFTVIMALLSRWSGGLVDRLGARLPLVIGPLIVAIGFGLLALTVRAGAYWAFLASLAVIGLGMAVSVAPLTTTVINAVPAHQTGVASGINNAVASLASLLAVAIGGAAALAIYDRSLDRDLARISASPQLVQTVDAARGKFATASTGTPGDVGDRAKAASIITTSLAQSIEDIMWIAAALSLGAAACGLLLPRSRTVIPGGANGPARGRAAR
jgi:EmrB/QacA subfamily drug resistance transporter